MTLVSQMSSRGGSLTICVTTSRLSSLETRSRNPVELNKKFHREEFCLKSFLTFILLHSQNHHKEWNDIVCRRLTHVTSWQHFWRGQGNLVGQLQNDNYVAPVWCPSRVKHRWRKSRAAKIQPLEPERPAFRCSQNIIFMSEQRSFLSKTLLHVD